MPKLKLLSDLESKTIPCEVCPKLKKVLCVYSCENYEKYIQQQEQKEYQNNGVRH